MKPSTPGEEIDALIKDIRGASRNAPVNSSFVINQLIVEIHRLRKLVLEEQAKVETLLDCAKVDVTMEGPRVTHWNPIKLNKAFYIVTGSTPPAKKP